MRSTDLLLSIVSLACVVAAPACGGDDGVQPPPDDEIFKEVLVNTDSNDDGYINDLDDVDMDRLIDTEPRQFFNEEAFQKYCVTPDADSFDDFEKINIDTGRIEIPRGITTLSTYCEADGIKTGPLQETMIPSSWCKRRNCPKKSD